jgi:hypothetical protein
MREKEVQMVLSDTIVQRTMNAKNSVEAYIYDMRSKVSDKGMYSDYISPADRQTFTTALAAMEDWLYSAGDDVSRDEYAKKLEELQKFGNPVVNRYNERRVLPNAVLALRAKCSEYVQNVREPRYAHIPAEELQTVVSKADETRKWLEDEVEKNSRTMLSQDPTLNASAVTARQKELETTCNPILAKPKPKEEKPPEAPASAAAPDTATKTDGATPNGSAASDQTPATKTPNKDMDLD